MLIGYDLGCVVNFRLHTLKDPMRRQWRKQIKFCQANWVHSDVIIWIVTTLVMMRCLYLILFVTPPKIKGLHCIYCIENTKIMICLISMCKNHRQNTSHLRALFVLTKKIMANRKTGMICKTCKMPHMPAARGCRCSTVYSYGKHTCCSQHAFNVFCSGNQAWLMC